MYVASIENMLKIMYNVREVYIMTKEEIYAKLEYNGKYDTKIKTELRKMIKENKDNQELVAVLQEVQSELETGKAKVEINKLTNKDNKDKKEKVEKIEEKKEKKVYVKKEKKETSKKKKRKKKTPVSTIVSRILVAFFILLMVASSISTIFYYFNK